MVSGAGGVRAGGGVARVRDDEQQRRARAWSEEGAHCSEEWGARNRARTRGAELGARFARIVTPTSGERAARREMKTQGVYECDGQARTPTKQTLSSAPRPTSSASSMRSSHSAAVSHSHAWISWSGPGAKSPRGGSRTERCGRSAIERAMLQHSAHTASERSMAIAQAGETMSKVAAETVTQHSERSGVTVPPFVLWGWVKMGDA